MTDILLFDPAEFDLAIDDLSAEAIVCDVLEAAGGKLTGRIRLQKTVYLLEKIGLQTGFKYTYHHYGPYSADLAEAVETASIFGMIKEVIEHRKSDGARYSRFDLKSKPREEFDEFLNSDPAKSAISAFENESSTVLELAATAYWLKNEEKCPDWKSEIIRRKGVKTAGGRLEKAVALLSSIKLGEGISLA